LHFVGHDTINGEWSGKDTEYTKYWILGILRVLAALNNGCRTRPTDECSSI